MSRSIRLALFATTSLCAPALNGAAQAADAPRLKLCPGFTIVTAINESSRDYESIKTVVAMDDATVRLRYSSEAYVYNMFKYGPGELTKTVTTRVLRNEDMKSAKLYLQHFGDQLPDLVPETTAVSISSQMFRTLKEEGKAWFGVFVPFNVDKPTIDRDTHPNVYDNQMVAEVTRTPDPPPMKVVINSDLVDVPVMRFEGDFYGDKSEFYVIDDPDLPIMLKFRIGIDAIAPLTQDEIGMRQSQGLPLTRSRDRQVLQVVKIITPCKPAQVVVAPAPPVPVGTGDLPEMTGELPDGDGSTPDGGGPTPLPTAPEPAPSSPAPPPTPPAPPPPAATPPAPAKVEPPKAAVEVTSAALEKAVESEGRVNIDAIFFTVDSANLRPESDVALSAIADVMRRQPTWKFSVQGHTDSQGGGPHNLDLSNRRAASVKSALVSRFGIAADRLTSVGYGLTKPVADNVTLAGRARNRRVELVRTP